MKMSILNWQSGAIMGVLAYVCSQHPDTELGILFLPMVTFSAGSVIIVTITPNVVNFNFDCFSM